MIMICIVILMSFLLLPSLLLTMCLNQLIEVSKKRCFYKYFFLKIGTSSVVYPAAGFAPRLAARGVPVAEFNLEETPATGAFR